MTEPLRGVAASPRGLLSGPGRLPASWRPWLVAAVAIGAVKVLWLLIDATPQFFLGDSHTYLITARTGGIPYDRSFLYGYGIRVVAFYTKSLVPLLVVQSLAAGAVALLVFVVLRGFVGVRQPVALGAALLAALDPLQIYLERAVLPDVPAMAFTAAYIAAALWVSRAPRLWHLAALQALSVLIVSMRTSSLPLIYVVSASVPVLAVWWIAQKPRTRGRDRQMLRTGLLTVFGLVFFFWLFHSGYKQLVGALTDRPPAYIHADGLFLFAFLSPILEPEDATDPRVAALIRERKPTLTHERRLYEMFGPEGLVNALIGQTDRLEANRLAKETARAALVRDPFGAAGLGWQTYAGFFQTPLPDRLRNNINMQVRRPLPDNFRTLLAEHFGTETTADWNARMTPAKCYALFFSGWLYVLLLSPLVALGAAWAGRGAGRALGVLLFLLSATLLASHYILVTSLRFLLVPGSFFVPLALGILADGLWTRWRASPPPADAAP